jgi:hypothetical protein
MLLAAMLLASPKRSFKWVDLYKFLTALSRQLIQRLHRALSSY